MARALVGILVVVIIATAALGAYGWHALHTPADPGGEETWVKIPRGASVSEIEAQLVARGLLRPRTPWTWYLRLRGQDTQLRSGTFALSPAQSPLEIAAQLAEGRTVLLPVTLPEGLTEAQSLGRLGEALAVARPALEEAARAVGESIPGARRTGTLNGYLFPETYHFEHETPPVEILKTLTRALFEFFGPVRQETAARLGLDLHQVLTLASIIEAETARPEERRRISAVYHNRLRRGMLLQADPTVAYATGRIGQPLWHKHLEVDSPYNTYRHAGLPPGPINSPGRESIDAALDPLADCSDLYFVARGDGTHIFSASLQAHERAKRSVRRER